MLTTNYNEALDKLQKLIAQGQEGAAKVINNVLNNAPTDELPKAGLMEFGHTDKTLTVNYPAKNGEVVNRTLHRNALGQMAATVGIPTKFIDDLQGEKGDWGPELLAHNLNTVFHSREPNKRYLTRSHNGEIRGFLSDTYRRIDSRPVIEAFATAVQNKGAMPYAGTVTDTKFQIQAIMPKVYEPTKGEIVAFGLSLENSDYGNGALSLRAYLLRIWCNNLAVTDETMRKIHLGGRLDENLIYSQRTYRLDADTTVSALKDTMSTQFDAKVLDAHMERMRLASETGVTSSEAAKRLKALFQAGKIQKGESEAALEAFESNDTYNLPEGESAWRLSNALSWIANAKTVTPERKFELTKIAGEVLPKAA